VKLPFGLQITRRKSASSVCLDNKPVASDDHPGLFYRNDGEHAVYSYRRPNVGFDIIWPEPPQDMNPELVNLSLSSLVLKVEKMLRGDHFDICPITSIVSDFSIDKSEDADVAIEILRSIHCIDYRHLPKGMKQRIPSLLSCVFTGGAFPLSQASGGATAAETAHQETAVAKP